MEDHLIEKLREWDDIPERLVYVKEDRNYCICFRTEEATKTVSEAKATLRLFASSLQYAQRRVVMLTESQYFDTCALNYLHGLAYDAGIIGPVLLGHSFNDMVRYYAELEIRKDAEQGRAFTVREDLIDPGHVAAVASKELSYLRELEYQARKIIAGYDSPDGVSDVEPLKELLEQNWWDREDW